MNEYPVLDPPDAVAVRVALLPLPIVTGSTVTLGSEFTVITAEVDFAVGVGVDPWITPVSVKMK